MAGERAPAPAVDDERMATMVSGWPAAIRCATRLSGLTRRTRSAGALQDAAGAAASSAVAGTNATVAAAAARASAVADRKKYGKGLTVAQPLAALPDAPRRL